MTSSELQYFVLAVAQLYATDHMRSSPPELLLIDQTATCTFALLTTIHSA